MEISRGTQWKLLKEFLKTALKKYGKHSERTPNGNSKRNLFKAYRWIPSQIHGGITWDIPCEFLGENLGGFFYWTFHVINIFHSPEKMSQARASNPLNKNIFFVLKIEIFKYYYKSILSTIFVKIVIIAINITSIK